jgi:ADP-ribose pyrophosphatase YjhB (NUDIX family)
MTVTAAGTIFIARDTKRILLNFRSNTVSKPNCWGFWGGKLNTSETIMTGLEREIIEEIGFLPKYERLTVIDEFLSNDKHFKYYSFAIIVSQEFIPIINSESMGYAWVSLNNYPKPLHPGARAILENASITKALGWLLECGDGSNFPPPKPKIEE